MMLPACTSGKAKVFAWMLVQRVLAKSLSKIWPWKSTGVPSGRMVRARTFSIFTFFAV